MSDSFYFGPGPTTLPAAVKSKIIEGIDRCHGQPVGILEISHKSDYFLNYTNAMESKFRSLLSVPDDYAVIFMPAGARHQYNLLLQNFVINNKSLATYVHGHWSKLMATWAADMTVCYDDLALLEEQAHKYDYIQTVSNETVDGTSLIHPFMSAHTGVLLDATSDLCLRPIPIENYACVFAATQKTLGVAGMSVAIVRRDLLIKFKPSLATQSYEFYAASHSLSVTPPVFAWWVCGLMVDWMLEQGGISKLYADLQQRSHALYTIITAHKCYKCNYLMQKSSLQNICFDLLDVNMRDDFLFKANAAGLYGLSGHKMGSDIRINLYHNVTVQAFESLCRFLQSYRFESEKMAVNYD